MHNSPLLVECRHDRFRKLMDFSVFVDLSMLLAIYASFLRISHAVQRNLFGLIRPKLFLTGIVCYNLIIIEFFYIHSIKQLGIFKQRLRLETRIRLNLTIICYIYIFFYIICVLYICVSTYFLIFLQIFHTGPKPYAYPFTICSFLISQGRGGI